MAAPFIARKKKVESKYNLQALYITKAGTYGTDGQRLIKVSLPKDGDVPFGTAMIPVTTCRDLNKQLQQESEVIPSGIVETLEDGKAPGFDTVLRASATGEPSAEFTCNAGYLADLLKAAATFSDSQHKTVRLRVYGQGRALRIDAQPTEDGQEFAALLMPVRTPVEIPGDRETGAVIGNQNADDSQVELLLNSEGRRFRTDDLT